MVTKIIDYNFGGVPCSKTDETNTRTVPCLCIAWTADGSINVRFARAADARRNVSEESVFSHKTENGCGKIIHSCSVRLFQFSNKTVRQITFKITR